MYILTVYQYVNTDVELCLPQAIDAGATGHARVSLNRFDLATLTLRYRLVPELYSKWCLA